MIKSLSYLVVPFSKGQSQSLRRRLFSNKVQHLFVHPQIYQPQSALLIGIGQRTQNQEEQCQFAGNYFDRGESIILTRGEHASGGLMSTLFAAYTYRICAICRIDINQKIVVRDVTMATVSTFAF